ncbi:hypothetical protein [Parabacteroides goldsteinii]|uniref:hypothetical protein n=1 Tax=Parabacteroides goldsteinii TaxID=328812 RepID=UPI0026DD9194|nr:hypothetical protein [Parabacteroides goldsteinii]
MNTSPSRAILSKWGVCAPFPWLYNPTNCGATSSAINQTKLGRSFPAPSAMATGATPWAAKAQPNTNGILFLFIEYIFYYLLLQEKCSLSV